MNDADTTVRRAALWLVVFLIPLGLAAGLDAVVPRPAAAQDAPPPPDPMDLGQADDAAGGPSTEAGPVTEAGQTDTDTETDDAAAGQAESEVTGEPRVEAKISILNLLLSGGHLMWPIAVMSLLVVTLGIERALGLRRRKILPPELIGGLGRLAGQKGGLDPRQAYKLCQQYPSAAAAVIKTMLLKVGRPHTEVEHAVTEANEREAARLYANVRWLNLAAAVTPLMGLLGTVWGMIQAFFATASLTPGQNKAEALAQGIYVALATTFAGLTVAIPAAILAHWFEGRIQQLFRELDETLLGLMPQLERFEGRLRVSKDQMDVPAADAETAKAPGAAKAGQQQPAAAPK